MPFSSIEETSLCAMRNDLPLRCYQRRNTKQKPLQSSGILDESMVWGMRAVWFSCATKLNAFILSENKWWENQSFPDESTRARWTALASLKTLLMMVCHLLLNLFHLRRNALAFIGFIFLIGLFGNQFSFDCVFIVSTVARKPPSRTMNFAIAKKEQSGIGGKYYIFECTRWIVFRARLADPRRMRLLSLCERLSIRSVRKRMPYPSPDNTNIDTEIKY